MTPIHMTELPESALLKHYQRSGAYTDCYCMELPRIVAFDEYVEAFYTTALFKVERAILSVVASKPADDRQARQLASRQTEEYSAWTVEARADDQLLLCDILKRTRSWLMCAPSDGETTGTRLYFGSAVVPSRISPEGQVSFGPAFHVLHGFHHAYTRALMLAARARLAKAR